jgi:glycosyltransferase involved in cell wall biosynthesis
MRSVANHTVMIGYLLKTYPKLSETFILNEILELERQGLRLHLFSLRSPSDSQCHPGVSQVKADVTYLPTLLPTFSWKDARSLLSAHLQLFWQHPLRYIRTLYFHGNRLEEKHWNEFWQGGYLALKMQQLDIDYLHVHFANIPAATAEIAKHFCGVPFSITAHAKDIYLSDSATLDRKFATAEFVLTCTNFNQQYLTKIANHNTPIRLAYHGLDLQRFALNESDVCVANLAGMASDSLAASVPHLLSVGRFCEKKGFFYLLEACHWLKQQGYAFRCTIVGYGPLQPQIERFIQEHHLTHTVHLAGKLTQDQLITLYHQADLFVLPCIITEDGDRDGIPNVLLEAMAMQIPVISTRISGIAELVDSGRTGILVPQKDATALAAAIEQLLSQPELRKQLGQAGCTKVRQCFALDRNVEQVKNLLLQALQLSNTARLPKGLGGIGDLSQTLEEAIR